jgi:hypothetical protein
MGQAGQMFGQPVSGQAQLTQAGLGALGAGQQLMGQPTFGTAPTQAASQQAFGLGGQFMGAAGAQPADINLLRGQFAGEVGGLLGQQPSAGVGALGQQALGLGMAGLGTVAPSDVEALRQQYGGLAGQAAQQVCSLLAHEKQKSLNAYVLHNVLKKNVSVLLWSSVWQRKDA